VNRLLALLALVVAVLTGASARADDPVITPARDVPLVLQPASLVVPPVPASFERHDRGWLQLRVTPTAHDRVQGLLREADEMRARLESALGHPVLEHVEVRVARSPEEMAQLAPQDVPPPTYAEGVAYPGLHLVILSLIAPRTYEAVDLEEVFRHELAHVALEDAVAGNHVPAWFNEGLAIELSGEHAWKRLQTLWNARMAGSYLPLADLDRHMPTDNLDVSLAYAQAGDFVRYLLRQADRARFVALVSRVRAGQPFDRALADAYGADLRRLEFQWKQDVERRLNYGPMLAGGGLLWGLVLVVLVAAYVKRRRAARATLARWEREEAAVDAAVAAAALRAERERERDEGEAGMRLTRTGSVAKVEHEGGWHTLH